jgi:hypothetical protein
MTNGEFRTKNKKIEKKVEKKVKKRFFHENWTMDGPSSWTTPVVSTTEMQPPGLNSCYSV